MRDVKATLDRLVAEGELVGVARASGPAFARTDVPVLDPSEIRALLDAMNALTKLLKSATRGGKHVLREDVERLSPRASEASASMHYEHRSARVVAGAPERSPTTEEALLQEVARRVRAIATPTHVPSLLRSMKLSADVGRRVLLLGSSRGLFDLEPESGMGRLSAEDAALCPPGPMGTRLSWIQARASSEARA